MRHSALTGLIFILSCARLPYRSLSCSYKKHPIKLLLRSFKCSAKWPCSGVSRRVLKLFHQKRKWILFLQILRWCLEIKWQNAINTYLSTQYNVCLWYLKKILLKTFYSKFWILTLNIKCSFWWKLTSNIIEVLLSIFIHLCLDIVKTSEFFINNN